ncbi:uncharacterized protein [Lolium perenne]|uniref:uncharacterized protein n=1 Tax=Lolium perenne TaxID=4522 RepID=UPI003A996EC8
MAREFEALALNGHNYPTWAMDTKIALASRGIDFKSIGEYNHEVHKISSKLRFCGKEPTNAEKIEKTLSTMLPSDAEKHDELLAKNGSRRPVGSQPLPEVHMNVANGRKFDGGFKGKPSNFNGKRKRNRNRKPRNSDRGKGTAKSKFDKSKLCDKCGCYTHPTDKCKTPRHLAILYQQSHGRNAPRGKRFEANFNLHPDGTDGAGHSQDVPSGPSNAVTLLPSKDPEGTEDMMVEYTSTDVFGDFD